MKIRDVLEAHRLAKDIATAQQRSTREVKREMGQLKGELERRIEEAAEEERRSGKVQRRCPECGNLWQYCTCGGKVPHDCPTCIAGRGKGDVVVRKGSTAYRLDRLCTKHRVIAETVGFPPRNRSEKRAGTRTPRGNVQRRVARAHNPRG